MGSPFSYLKSPLFCQSASTLIREVPIALISNPGVEAMMGNVQHIGMSPTFYFKMAATTSKTNLGL